MIFFKKNVLSGTVFSAFLLLVLASTNAHAIPAFTRANKVECTTCHTIYPELNEYGEAFLKNSYVYFGKGIKGTKTKESTPPPAAKAAPASKSSAARPDIKGAGNADTLNKLKAGALVATDDTPAESAAVVSSEIPAEESQAATTAADAKSEGLLLSAIPEQLPISFTASINGSYNRNAVNEFDFSTRSLKLSAGGNFAEKAGFFGTYLIYTENVANIANTSQTPGNLTSKNDIGELFLIWRHALGSPINLKIGRLQPKLGLWKSNNKLSATNSLAPYAYTVGSQSVFRLEQPQDALEANAILANRLFVAGGVVNRKQQNTKEGYGHISYKFGGADFVANEPEIDLNKDESVFDFLVLTIGGYGYFGTNGNPNTTAGVTPTQNKFYRTGVDLDILYKLFRMRLAGVMGRDDNPELTVTAKAVKSYVAAVEGQYSFLENLIGALRVEYQDDGRGYVRRYIPTLGYTPLQNVKVAAEYKHEIATSYKDLPGNNAQDFINRIGTLGVTFSF